MIIYGSILQTTMRNVLLAATILCGVILLVAGELSCSAVCIAFELQLFAMFAQ
jgi:hypothetical protein